MDLAELEERLGPFARAKYERDDVEISRVHAMPGHAGFAYGFDAQYGGTTDRWFIRLPPPNVNWRGTADVLRQVEVLNALDTTSVPHCSVQWSGDDLEWFGSPYFVVPQLDGDVLRLAPGEWAHDLPIDVRRSIARQSMTALAGIHRVDVSNVPYLGDAVPFRDDVERWDRFYERSADIHLLERAPECRERLLATIPHDAPVGIFHGDFQMSNLFFSPDYQLLAVIDWELTGIGATLNDVGWICTFADRAAWAPSEDGSERPVLLEPDEIVAFYVEAMGEEVPSVDWFRALAAYKFAIISGLNLSLHRRGKRHDPTWEVGRLSMPTLIDRALELLN